MGKYAKLIMVAVSDGQDPKKAAQSNKYYEMTENGAYFDVVYGRVESTAINESYPMSMWDKKYKEKIRKGYVDKTHTVMVEEVQEEKEEIKFQKIEEEKVELFLTLMNKYTSGLVKKTYTVKAQNVTQAQVDNAQGFLDKLQATKKTDTTGINNLLLQLYMEIPRRMGNVKDYLLPKINLNNVLQQEQDNLDAMASQIAIAKPKKKEKEKAKVDKKTLLDLLGLDKMTEIKTSKEIDFLVKQISGKKVQALFEVQKSSEEKRFNDWLSTQSNKKTGFVYHGTKCTSVIPILEQGLKIRPTGNFQFSGKAYGNGNYFSEQYSTSIGYTDGHYTGDAVMLIYEIHIGKESKSSFNDYSSCQRAGYDSFNGGWLRVAYREEQSKIKYVIWLK